MQIEIINFLYYSGWAEILQKNHFQFRASHKINNKKVGKSSLKIEISEEIDSAKEFYQLNYYNKGKTWIASTALFF